MVFFAVLYPSVSIDEAVAVIIEVLNNDIDDLGERVKLILTVVHKLIKLFLSANYFIFHNHVRFIENSTLIGVTEANLGLLQHSKWDAL